MSILIFILFLYFIPILYITFKKKIDSDKLDKIIYDRTLTIALSYLLLTTTLLPILASLLSSEKIDFLKSLNSIAWLIIFFSFLIVGLSLYIEYVFRQLSLRFKVLPNGYIDENTGLENISLRHDTFIDLIEGIEDSEKLASISKTIGKNFGATIVRKHKIIEFSRLEEYWKETDKKSSFLANVEFSISSDVLVEIKIKNSFAKKANKRRKEYKKTHLCIFLENYSNGIIEAFYKQNELSNNKNLKLSESVCANCKDGDHCSLILK